MKKRISSKSLLLIFLFAFTVTSYPQVTIGSGEPPLAGALLQLKENDSIGINSTKGLGLPRVKLTAIDNLSPCVDNTLSNRSSHIGLTVYNMKDNSSTDATLTEGVYVWNGSVWTKYTGGVSGFNALNGLSLEGENIILGGLLDRNTTISGTNTLTFDTPTTVGKTLDVTGVTTLTGNLVSNGTTSLKSTNIGVKNGATILHIEDGTNSSKTGKYLKAMDESGRAEWQNLGTLSTTQLGIFGSGLEYDPVTSNNPTTSIPLGATIVVPPGRWLIMVTCLIQTMDFSKAGGRVWVTLEVNPKEGSNPSLINYQYGPVVIGANAYSDIEWNPISGQLGIENSTHSNVTFELCIKNSIEINWPRKGSAGFSKIRVAHNVREASLMGIALSQ